MAAALFQDTSNSPRRGGPGEGRRRGGPAREPVFNAPGIVVALVAVIVGSYALQTRFPFDGMLWAFAFSPHALAEGRWYTLLSALFVHQGWAHALMNAAMAFAFATPVARFFGPGAVGAGVFGLFYLLCGVLSSLGFAALHLHEPAAVIGASGAVSGLVGAAARLIAGRGRVGPILSPPVLGLGGVWLGMNVLVAAVGSSLMPGADGAPVAWEAHIAGFLAGVLLIGPFARLARTR